MSRYGPLFTNRISFFGSGKIRRLSHRITIMAQMPSEPPQIVKAAAKSVTGTAPVRTMTPAIVNCTMTRERDMIEYMKKSIIGLCLITALLSGQTEQPNGAELQIAVNKLSVVGSVLYIAAHPDDENTALLSYFAKGRKLRTGYLSLTRGEGGQNLIGSEQGSQLGLIRTQELLAARRVDGAEQFFTRAIDFGYTKSSEEALRFWNKDSVVKDAVRIIRTFRPDIIITRFTPLLGGHGQHLASAIVAEEAFRLAADSTAYPDQLTTLAPWKAKRLLFNRFNFGGAVPTTPTAPAFKIDLGEYNPLLGRSYNELSAISRTMHKSQAMGSALNRGTSVNEFVITAGDTAMYDLFDDIDLTWNRIAGGKKLVRLAADVLKRFTPSAPEKSIGALLKFYTELQKAGNDPYVRLKMRETESVILACAGLSLDARADRPFYTRGDSITVKVTAVNRSSSFLTLDSIGGTIPAVNKRMTASLAFNVPLQTSFSSAIPSDAPYTQPFWLELPPRSSLYTISDQSLIGLAEGPELLSVNVLLKIEENPILIHVPVHYVWVDDVDGERTRPCQIVPAISVEMADRDIVWTNAPSKKVSVRIHGYHTPSSGVVTLRSAAGWVLAEEQRFTVTPTAPEATVEFTLFRDTTGMNDAVIAQAEAEKVTYRSAVVRIEHPHIPPQVLLTEASARSVPLRTDGNGVLIGYIMGAGDEVPAALTQMGFVVQLISDAELKHGTFEQYQAIVAGVRAYNTREQLRLSHRALMNYVQAGGTYIVQYQVLEKGQTDELGPYPFELSRNRITDERAAISFLKPTHRMLTSPNIITAADFDGWVQERGTYYPSQWDPKYETILSMADPNEAPQNSAVLYAHYGKGNYYYSGLAFFRQLPAGVVGAYRLFENMLLSGDE